MRSPVVWGSTLCGISMGAILLAVIKLIGDRLITVLFVALIRIRVRSRSDSGFCGSDREPVPKKGAPVKKISALLRLKLTNTISRSQFWRSPSTVSRSAGAAIGIVFLPFKGAGV